MPSGTYGSSVIYYQRANDMPIKCTILTYTKPGGAPQEIQRSYTPKPGDAVITQSEYETLIYDWEQARQQAIDDTTAAMTGGG